MNEELFLKEVTNFLTKTLPLYKKKKIKALQVINSFEKKWEAYMNKKEYYDLASNIWFEYLLISQTLNKQETEIYGNSLPD